MTTLGLVVNADDYEERYSNGSILLCRNGEPVLEVTDDEGWQCFKIASYIKFLELGITADPDRWHRLPEEVRSQLTLIEWDTDEI